MEKMVIRKKQNINTKNFTKINNYQEEIILLCKEKVIKNQRRRDLQEILRNTRKTLYNLSKKCNEIDKKIEEYILILKK